MISKCESFIKEYSIKKILLYKLRSWFFFKGFIRSELTQSLHFTENGL